MGKISFYIILLSFVNCTSSESIKNLQNCKELKLGMSERQVIEKMGKPLSSRIYYSNHIGDSVKLLNFKYDALAASTGIVVEVNVNSELVVRVNCDEEFIVE